MSEAREGTPEPPPRRTALEAAKVPAPEPPNEPTPVPVKVPTPEAPVEPTIDDVIVVVHQKEGCRSLKYLDPKVWL